MPPERLRVARILWAAITMSAVMIPAVGWFVAQQQPAGGPPDPAMAGMLGLVALVTAVLSVVLPGRLLRTALVGQRLVLADRPESERMFADRPRRARVFANPQAARNGAVAAFMTSLIIGIALAEAVALDGLVLVVMRAPLLWGLPFFVVSWAILASKFPRPEQPLRSLEQAYDADLE
jgi:hypothetical protein